MEGRNYIRNKLNKQNIGTRKIEIKRLIHPVLVNPSSKSRPICPQVLLGVAMSKRILVSA